MDMESSNIGNNSGSNGVLFGPWEQAFWVMDSIAIKSKSNFRRGANSRTSWRSQQSFEEEIALLLKASVPKNWPKIENLNKLIDRPIIISTTIAKSTIDAGNHSKSILDAAERVIYANDAQVALSSSIGLRGRRDPLLMISFACLPAKSSLKNISKAGRELLKQSAEIYNNKINQ